MFFRGAKQNKIREIWENNCSSTPSSISERKYQLLFNLQNVIVALYSGSLFVLQSLAVVL